MWVPRSGEELEAAARAGNLVETHTFDAKRELPSSGKNRDLAVDVCAMTVDGGVLVYGLGEDTNKRLTVLAPFEVAGARERADQIAQMAISEPPEIRTFALATTANEALGYLVVLVPPSPRAPHQVTVGGDRRYYGRGDPHSWRVGGEV